MVQQAQHDRSTSGQQWLQAASRQRLHDIIDVTRQWHDDTHELSDITLI